MWSFLFFLVTGTRWKVGGLQIQLTFSGRFDSLSFPDAWRWTPGGIGKGKEEGSCKWDKSKPQGAQPRGGTYFYYPRGILYPDVS